MAEYKVTIIYGGVSKDPEQVVAPICRIFEPNNSYIDTDVYNGIDVPQKDGEDAYGKSVYATNVAGWGEIPMPEPYASTSIPFPIPLAQFKLAMVGEIVDGKNQVSFTVSDYTEAFYYQQIGYALESQGFNVTVEEVTA